MAAEVDLVEQAWHTLGPQLAASRRAAGLNQEQLAAATGYSRSTIANAETGRQHVQRQFWTRCDAALSTGTALTRGHDDITSLTRRTEATTALAARRTRSQLSRPEQEPAPDTAHPHSATGQDTLESLRLQLNDALHEGAIPSTSLETWDQAVAVHGRATRTRPPADLLTEISADLTDLHQALRRCQSASSLQHLTRTAAQLSGLACLLLVRLDDREAFLRWAHTARTAAAEAGDPAVLSWVLAQEAYGHYYRGNLREAVTIARHAQTLLPRTASTGSVLAAALEARAHAARREPREARRALARAETGLSALPPDSVTASAFGYSESQFRFHEENVYTQLGDTRSAWRAQEQALQVCSPDDYTDWALTRLDRAACLLHDGDPASALTYATHTLTTLAPTQTQGIITTRAQQLIRALPSTYQKAPAAQDLQDLLHESLRGAR